MDTTRLPVHHMHHPSQSDDNLSDNESTPLTQDIYSGSQNTVQVTKGWDVFRDPPRKVDSGSMANQQCLQITVKILKVIAYLVTFTIVLVGGIISKSSLLFMTSQLHQNRPLQYCNHDLGRDKQFVVLPSMTERVAWIWCLIIAFVVPELGVLFRSARICFFKSWKKPPIGYFMVVFIAETMHTVGTALLVFNILPHLDVVKGAMLSNCLCIIPAFLGMLSRGQKESKRFIKTLIDLAAISVQITGLVVWSFVEQDNNLQILILTVMLISTGWWENYVSHQSPLRIIRVLGRVKDDLLQTRYFTYIFISIWKIICFFSTSLIILWVSNEKIGMIFTIFLEAFRKHSVTIQQVIPSTGNGIITPDVDFITVNGEEVNVDVSGMVSIHTVIIHILASYLCYIFGKFACKIMIQGFSYAFPVNLMVPVSVSVLIAACGLRSENPCYFNQQIPNYIFFNSPSVSFLNDFIYQTHAWVWLLWLLAQTWITIHVWTPKCERLATTEKLFVTPMYNGLFIDQSLSLNRRRDDQADVKTEDLAEIEREKADEYYETISVHTDGSVIKPNIKSSDQITRIYACTTMWHETKEEMMDFLKSILRLDEDQCARRVAQKYLRVVDPDYYEFETHIFLDDAFEITDDPEKTPIVNRFVKVLISTIDEAASDVHQTNIRIRPPKKYPTPYGGRLIWTLPGKTKMICHLKDKAKIRHRKRWSQVMYMYYLLGHRLMELPISVDRKDVMAENTYLLTLDGDIDFQPQAVQLLVDLMKKNRNLGAACGRIHPVGSGPMVWYQKFEYAIGHWLQKATEHMIGCVLCSPGCFSLFRGKALMDDNVLRKYTTKAEEARHYVQYDQGEDRWLCTLLLQRGYRVEYSAASDAYTHCPEGFNEFYNQRRRWVPSTIANIMDLLSDSKRTIKINDNISMPYICYQILLMGGTILGPGTIFLMLVGAFVAAFQIDNWTSFYYNIVPILFFILVCFTCKSNVQLIIAQILSTIYALVMMAVIVGTALQLREDGYGSPSAIFLTAMSSSFLIAALLHPQEFSCILPAIIYLLSIPSMYLLLILYSIINLNVVTWGTREIVQKKTQKQIEEEKKAEALRKRHHNSLFSFLQHEPKLNDDDEGGIEFSLANLFKCMFFTHKKENPEREQLLHIAKSLENLDERLDGIENILQPHKPKRSKSDRSDKRKDDKGKESKNKNDNKDTNDEEIITETSSSNSSANRVKRDDLYNPYWIEDPDLPKSAVDYLSSNEITFWKDLMDKYLYPIDANKEEQDRIKHDLIELRNTCVFAFLMFNALFVMIVFLLQLNKDQIHVKWPFGAHTNVTYIEETAEVVIKKEYLQLEPIGLVFVFFFSLILVIQFTAMLFHRFGTISHILAATELNFCCTNKTEELSQDALIDKHAIEIVKNLQRLQGIDDGDYENEISNDQIGRRRTIHNLERAAQRKRNIGTLDVAFKRRFFNMKANAANSAETPILTRRMSMHKETIKALETRRNSVLAERQKSHMKTLGASNEYIANNGRSTRNTNSVKDLFAYGQINRAFDSSIYDSNNSVSIQMNPK